MSLTVDATPRLQRVGREEVERGMGERGEVEVRMVIQ